VLVLIKGYSYVLPDLDSQWVLQEVTVDAVSDKVSVLLGDYSESWQFKEKMASI
jgi:hypothetical protein